MKKFGLDYLHTAGKIWLLLYDAKCLAIIIRTLTQSEKVMKTENNVYWHWQAHKYRGWEAFKSPFVVIDIMISVYKY